MSNFQKQVFAELKRDKKKTAIMAVLLLVAVALVGRVVLKAGKPAMASAATTVKNPPAARLARSSDPAATESGESDREKVRNLGPIDTTITRDIFATNPKYFPSGKTVDVPAEIEAARTDDLAAEREAILARARELSLQSTVLSASPTAIIEGQVLRVGDTINGYNVVEIGPRQCTLEKNGVRVSIEMK
jgi:hypothetical protein